MTPISPESPLTSEDARALLAIWRDGDPEDHEYAPIPFWSSFPD